MSFYFEDKEFLIIIDIPRKAQRKSASTKDSSTQHVFHVRFVSPPWYLIAEIKYPSNSIMNSKQT